MPLKPRDESPGFHHVVCRGNNKRAIVVNDVDRDDFCDWVNVVAREYRWPVLAWCLMNNHYHLVIEVTDMGLAAGMCKLNSGYARRFNARHGRINHLFGKRYWNDRIKTHAQMLNVVRYVVQNPIRAGGKEPLHRYAWTSYAATIGLAHSRIELARDAVLPFFGRDAPRAIEEFRVFCAAVPLGTPPRWQPP